MDVPFENWHVTYHRVIRSKNRGSDILVIRFISPFFRNSWLKAKKNKGVIKCNELRSDQPQNQIFIYQRRTAAENRTFIEARKFIIDRCKYFSCWMTDGVILYKRTADSRVLTFDPALMEQDFSVRNDVRIPMDVPESYSEDRQQHFDRHDDHSRNNAITDASLTPNYNRS